MVPKLEVVIAVNDTKVTVELDTATAANFLSLQKWQRLEKPQLSKTLCKFQSASKHAVPVRGSFEATTSYRNCTTNLIFMVTEVLGLNLQGRVSFFAEMAAFRKTAAQQNSMQISVCE